MRRGAGGVALHHGYARRHHGASRHKDHLSNLEEPSEASSSHEAQMQSSASPYRSYEVSSASADFSKLGGSSFRSSTLPRTKSSASVRRGSAGAAVRKREQKRALQAAKKAEEERLRKQLEQWFAEFDTDGNKQLDREELRKLLAHIFPEAPPDEVRREPRQRPRGAGRPARPPRPPCSRPAQAACRERCRVPPPPWAQAALDFLIRKATQIVSASLTIEGNVDGLVPWNATVQTVTRYSAYLKHKAQLDELFSRFDQDNNGLLEPSELRQMLSARAPLGAATRRHPPAPPPARPAAHAARSVSDGARGAPPGDAGSLTPGMEVTDGDVQFVLDNCDVNNDHVRASGSARLAPGGQGARASPAWPVMMHPPPARRAPAPACAHPASEPRALRPRTAPPPLRALPGDLAGRADEHGADVEDAHARAARAQALPRQAEVDPHAQGHRRRPGPGRRRRRGR